MQIQKSTAFTFSFQSGGINYNFSIVAISQDGAIERLSNGLTEVLAELKREQGRPAPMRN